MIIAYVYDRTWSIVMGQIQTVLGFSCTIKLNDVSTADLTIANNDIPDVANNIKENNRIKVYRQYGTVEKLLIEWYIRWFEASLTQTTIKIEDKLSIFDDKLFYSDVNYNGTIKWLLQNIVDTINSREDTGISLDCDVLDTFSKTYGKWEIIGNAIKDIRQNKYEYRILNNVFSFKNAIGIDRSVSGSDYLEFNFDYLNPNSRTIRDAKVVGDIKSMANAAIGKNGNTIEQYEDATSIAEFWRIERPFTSNGSVGDSVRGFVDERKDSIREYDISPMSNDFFICDIWDVVQVYINSGNDLMFYSGTMKVIEKTFKAGELDTITIKLAKGKVKTKNLADELKDIKTRVSKIEYNQ